MKEMNMDIDYLRQYLESYVKRMFSLELSIQNLEQIFNFNGNERHQYPLYFLWVLPEFTQWYIDNNKEEYMMLGSNFTYHMTGLFNYNSFLLDDLHKKMSVPIDFSFEDLVSAKVKLGNKLMHVIEGSQKFLWSFISKIESMKNEISASLQ